MKFQDIGLIGLFIASTETPTDWVEITKSLGLLGLLAYYIFVHEPRRAEADHKRRMEELELLRKEK